MAAVNVAASCADRPFSLEVVTCAKGYSARHFLTKSLRVFMCAHSRLMNIRFCRLVSIVPLKLSRDPQGIALCRLGHLWALPGPDNWSGGWIGRVMPEWVQVLKRGLLSQPSHSPGCLEKVGGHRGSAALGF